jgi:hypothetical protein
MASRKTWLWVLVGICAMGLVVLIAAAGAGVYYVTRHVQSEASSSAEAIRTFDAVKTAFADKRPLYELDRGEQPRATRPLSSLPTAKVPPKDLWVLVWDPENERVIKLSLPFWMLRVGKQKFSLPQGHGGVDLDHLDLDLKQLERIGPALVIDYRHPEGARVLLWTQ